MAWELDPNSWDDVEWWFEDEQEIYNLMQKYEDTILQLAKYKSLKIRDAVLKFSEYMQDKIPCIYCGSTHAVYWKTEVCIDCAFTHGNDKWEEKL